MGEETSLGRPRVLHCPSALPRAPGLCVVRESRCSNLKATLTRSPYKALAFSEQGGYCSGEATTGEQDQGAGEPGNWGLGKCCPGSLFSGLRNSP